MPDKLCPVCGSELRKDRFDGDWKVLVCTDSTCNTSVQSAISNPQQDGFTMESLQNLAKYDND